MNLGCSSARENMTVSTVKLFNTLLIRAFKFVMSPIPYALRDGGMAYKSGRFSKLSLSDVVYNLLQSRGFEGINIVQIGAHDGSSNNLLNIHALSALPKSEIILVEPNPYIFFKLQQLFSSHTSIQCVNVAVDVADQIRKFYAVDTSTEIPEWATQLSSFDIKQILKFKDRVPNIENHVRHIDVSCVTFDKIANMFSKKHIDIVLIDVEGYDAELVASIPFSIVRPHIVVFEHTHLSYGAIQKVIHLLIENDYMISATADDVIAFQTLC
jgi:FkbM family methyltransferase